MTARWASPLWAILLLWFSHVLVAEDCNHNDEDDAVDIATGTSLDCNGNAVPDECDVAVRFGFQAQYSLDSMSLFWLAWPRDSAIRAGDLNGDGRPELVTANSGLYDNPGSSVSVLVHQEDGTYAPEVFLDVGTEPRCVVLEDLDGDQDLDLAVANHVLDTVSVLINNGDATFALPEDFGIEAPVDLAPADVDRDGDVDLAVLQRYEYITILVNSGDGRFTSGPQFEGTVNNHSVLFQNVAMADVDLDGDNDLLASENYLAVWKNTGEGEFLEPEYYWIGENSGLCWTHGLSAVDLDGDGFVEVVTADYTDGGTPSVSVLRNDGDGVFVTPASYFFGVGDETQGFDTGDYDLDGDVDIVAVVGRKTWLIWNEGDGTFSEPIVIDADGLDGSSIVSVDVDGDGDLDLAVQQWLGRPDETARRILVLENTRNSADANQNGIPDECEAITVPFTRGDCNGDGVVAGQVTDAVFFLRYNFIGGVVPPCMAACDVDANGLLAGVSDAVYLLSYNFRGGPAPVTPYPECAPSTLATDLDSGCESSPERCP